MENKQGFAQITEGEAAQMETDKRMLAEMKDRILVTGESVPANKTKYVKNYS